jgi:hypothetical protein
VTLLKLVAAAIGVAVPLAVIVQAMRSKAADRWPEGLLIGVYLGAPGAVSIIALLDYFR